MNVNKRNRRDQPDGERGAEQRAPRSGGRTAAEQVTRAGESRRQPNGGAGTRRGYPAARGERAYPTEGSAALNQRRPDPTSARDRGLRVWDSTGEPDQTAESGRSTRAGLRAAPPLPVVGPRAPFVALVLTLVVGGMLGILVVNNKVNENAFRLEELNDQQATLDIQQQQLDQKIAEAEVPGNLAARARHEGLVESGPPAFIRMPDGRVIDVPQPSGGEPASTSQSGTGG